MSHFTRLKEKESFQFFRGGGEFTLLPMVSIEMMSFNEVGRAKILSWRGITMCQAFYKLDMEKQQRIIQAALQVFSKRDFKQASTDDIAAIAHISKGSLFQYFKNKKSLYLFLYEYALGRIEEEVDGLFNFEENDYFVILKKSLQLQMALQKKYSNLYQFFIKVNEELDPELMTAIAEINREKEVCVYRKLYGCIDNKKFKAGIDIKRVDKMINWCFEGIWSEMGNGQQSLEKIYQDIVDVIDFFKISVYKKEYLLQVEERDENKFERKVSG
ncbi:TetR/AcrR family transcriptional regulator [Salipaludibacillus sp. LMS25]|uniref:TetR/AcrR family transcriptional regulator n=1 Tax=Salipaludibacillus sp. LMS25 TaxID=2924031 RepID=UPI0020D0282F|nr:TetR/AcrR family transcriptional regulator [Salipaludibacillus sp. LMS25]UTR15890.1 TetR/AcrR family transcriptional regulator [Salipaludibacillus sp. LMS25]